MFKKVLVANRGEIAVRIIAACRQLAISTVVVYSTADEQAQFVQMADEAICVGPASAQESYLNREAILMAAQITGSDAIHPGYGFLSEDPLFATMVAECGLTWIGPSPDQIQRYADKERSRKLAQKRGVPTIPGSGLITDDRQ
ncbi:acetyl-CoA carboxylase biotin carboxylase subunit, partial [Pediococcus acidilactici]|nr:acetyl-CoA carboxylase biotin carboxylase subunit [Pediococcus acidilactici]